jgi:hypothetical protein
VQSQNVASGLFTGLKAFLYVLWQAGHSDGDKMSAIERRVTNVVGRSLHSKRGSYMESGAFSAAFVFSAGAKGQEHFLGRNISPSIPEQSPCPARRLSKLPMGRTIQATRPDRHCGEG